MAPLTVAISVTAASGRTSRSWMTPRSSSNLSGTSQHLFLMLPVPGYRAGQAVAETDQRRSPVLRHLTGRRVRMEKPAHRRCPDNPAETVSYVISDTDDRPHVSSARIATVHCRARGFFEYVTQLGSAVGPPAERSQILTRPAQRECQDPVRAVPVQLDHAENELRNHMVRAHVRAVWVERPDDGDVT